MASADRFERGWYGELHAAERWLSALLARVELKNFILPRFRMRFELKDMGGVAFVMEYAPPDRDTGKPIPLKASYYVPQALVHEASAFARDEVFALRWLHETILREALKHELDEAWHVDGVRVHDPHKDDYRG